MPVRKATLADAALIARIHVATWKTAYRSILPSTVLESLSVDARQEHWTRLLGTPNSEEQVFVVETTAKQMIGFASCGPNRDRDPEITGEIYAVYLLDDFQRQGYGLTFIEHCAEHLRRAGHRGLLVWVLTQNPACRFYERLGGVLLRSKMIEIGGDAYEETAYVWRDLDHFQIRHDG